LIIRHKLDAERTARVGRARTVGARKSHRPSLQSQVAPPGFSDRIQPDALRRTASRTTPRPRARSLKCGGYWLGCGGRRASARGPPR
jgi:hypothetical protein